MKKNALEWTVFALGIAAILVVFAALVRDFSGTSGPPNLSVRAGAATKVGDRWFVPVKVRNLGGKAAEAATVQGEAEGQQAEFNIDFIPQESEREGYLIFREEPQGLKVDVSGVRSP